MKRRSTSLPKFGDEPLLVEPQAALDDLKPVLDAGTELLKRYNGGENFANKEYEHWFDQFKDAVVRCFGQRSSAATYFQDPPRSQLEERARVDRLLEMTKRQGELEDKLRASWIEGEGHLLEPRQDAAEKNLQSRAKEDEQVHFLPDEKFEAIDHLRPVAIDRLRNEVATLGEWVRKLERQAPKKRL